MKKAIIMAISTISLIGCAAKTTFPEASNVEIVTEKSDVANCQFLGEVVGSQGNFLTGDFTSNKNLIIGARNELRNETHKLGGNIVYIQDMKNTNAYGSLGTTNSTAIGKAYYCKNKQ